MRLKNKRCLIIGGSSGIGLATARRFIDEGAGVVIAAINDGHLKQLLAGYSFHRCDATEVEQVDAVLAFTVKQLGGLDVLFHVAGGSGRKFGDGSLHECTDAGWQATLDLNLTSVFNTNRAAVRQFLNQKTAGTILNVSSVLAFDPSPHHFDTIAYAASKAGIIALSRQAASRYASDGIRVNVLAPGLIDTPMATRAIGDPAIGAYLQTKQPLGPGAGKAQDCAEAAVFLCSDEARFLTGVVLPIDGGWCVSEGQK